MLVPQNIVMNLNKCYVSVSHVQTLRIDWFSCSRLKASCLSATFMLRVILHMVVDIIFVPLVTSSLTMHVLACDCISLDLV